jgi:hypothetical protein
MALPAELLPDLPHTIDFAMLPPDALDVLA